MSILRSEERRVGKECSPRFSTIIYNLNLFTLVYVIMFLIVFTYFRLISLNFAYFRLCSHVFAYCRLLDFLGLLNLSCRHLQQMVSLVQWKSNFDVWMNGC